MWLDPALCVNNHNGKLEVTKKSSDTEKLEQIQEEFRQELEEWQ